MNGNGRSLKMFEAGGVKYAVVANTYPMKPDEVPKQGGEIVSGFTSLLANAMQTLQATASGEWEVVSHDVTQFDDHIVLSMILRQRTGS